MRPAERPILALDFDGVVHAYGKGWGDDSIYDRVTPGFFKWAVKANKHFRLYIYSSRSHHEGGILDMMMWLGGQAAQEGYSVTDMADERDGSPLLRLLNARTANLILFRFSTSKPPAFITIDDRAIQFRGDWNARWLEPEHLTRFKPWTQASTPLVCDADYKQALINYLRDMRGRGLVHQPDMTQWSSNTVRAWMEAAFAAECE